MLHMFLDDRPWFRPKRFGYGAGLPMAWQGWAMLVAHMAVIGGIIMLFANQPVTMVVASLIAAAAPIPIYRVKTKGGWHWRS